MIRSYHFLSEVCTARCSFSPPEGEGVATRQPGIDVLASHRLEVGVTAVLAHAEDGGTVAVVEEPRATGVADIALGGGDVEDVLVGVHGSILSCSWLTLHRSALGGALPQGREGEGCAPRVADAAEVFEVGLHQGALAHGADVADEAVAGLGALVGLVGVHGSILSCSWLTLHRGQWVASQPMLQMTPQLNAPPRVP